MLMNTSVSTFGTPAISRVGPANQIQIATYDIGPHLTTTLDDFADLNVMGRFAQVFFDNPNGSTASRAVQFHHPGKAPRRSIPARAIWAIKLITNAQVERDDHDFQAYNVQQSFFVGIFPQVRLIARGGYDNVKQPGIVNISAPMWSGGVRISRINRADPRSRSSMASATTIPPGPAICSCSFPTASTRQGRYFEAIQPNQLQINSAFVSFIAPTPASQLPHAVDQQQFHDQRQSSTTRRL